MRFLIKKKAKLDNICDDRSTRWSKTVSHINSNGNVASSIAVSTFPAVSLDVTMRKVEDKARATDYYMFPTCDKIKICLESKRQTEKVKVEPDNLNRNQTRLWFVTCQIFSIISI